MYYYRLILSLGKDTYETPTFMFLLNGGRFQKPWKGEVLGPFLRSSIGLSWWWCSRFRCLSSWRGSTLLPFMRQICFSLWDLAVTRLYFRLLYWGLSTLVPFLSQLLLLIALVEGSCSLQVAFKCFFAW